MPYLSEDLGAEEGGLTWKTKQGSALRAAAKIRKYGEGEKQKHNGAALP